MSLSRRRAASLVVLPSLIALAATTATTAFAQQPGAAPGAVAAPPATPPPASPVPPPPPPPPGGQPAPAYTGPPAYSSPPPQPAETPVPEAEHPKKTFGIFLDPLNTAFGTFGVEGSFSPAKVVAINFGFQYRKDDVGQDPVDRQQIDLTQYGVVLGAQIFPTTERWMRGFYLYPRGTLVRGSTNSTKVWQEATTSGAELAGMAGYQWRWDVGFAIRLGGGVAYRKVEVELKPNPSSGVIVVGPTKAGSEGARPIIEFALGWCF